MKMLISNFCTCKDLQGEAGVRWSVWGLVEMLDDINVSGCSDSSSWTSWCPPLLKYRSEDLLIPFVWIGASDNIRLIENLHSLLMISGTVYCTGQGEQRTL